MNSVITDDISREHFALEAVKCLKNISSNSDKVAVLHKELLEIDLSLTAFIEESKRRLVGLRLDSAHDAKSTQRVVEVLSQKCKIIGSFYEYTMSSTSTPHKRNQFRISRSVHESNNNKTNKFSERQQARTFIVWYKRMIDNERQNLGLYLSDDASLEWFGRTIKTRKKVTAFLKHDMQCSRHDFTTIESIDKIQNRNEVVPRKVVTMLASPHSPEIVSSRDRPCKRKLRPVCGSPQWAEGCEPPDGPSPEKKQKTDSILPVINCGDNITEHGLKRPLSEDESPTVNNQGDGMLRRVKRKCVLVTPPNREVGQGDCMPSTSGTDSDRSHDALNSQLPKLAVECNGYVEFTRTRNSRSTDAMKWERKCKMQVSYSEDPLNVGEYIIWAVRYTDDSKCRRNLLAAFEEAAKDEETKKI